MADLAELGIRISSEEAALADRRLDAFAASADRAEAASDSLAGGARRASTALATMNAAVRQQDAVLRAQQAAMRSSTLEGLNLSRQFADVGVSLASGMNPMLVFIQQGPQIADVFQQAAAEGRNFNTVLSGLYARLAPVLAPLAAVAVAAGSATAGFGLLNRELQKGIPDDITVGLGLTEEQLKRVESRSVTFGDTIAATFTVIGRHIMEGPVGEALGWLGDRFSEVMDWIAKTWVDGWALQIGVAVGAYKTIVENWRRFPAALGEIVIDGVNAAIGGIEDLVNAAVRGLNSFIDQANRLPFVEISSLAEQALPRIAQRFDGATADIGRSLQANVTAEIANARAALIALGREIGDEALARAVRRALEEAGDPNKGRSGGKSELEKRIDETLRYIEALKDQAATYGMSAIAAKQYEIAQRALKAPTEELRREIERYGEALLNKMRIEAADLTAKRDQLDVIRLERSLIGAANRERAVALAQLAEAQRLKNAGVDPSSDDGSRAIGLAGQIAGEGWDKDNAIDRFNDSLRLTLDLARQADDIMRDAARGFAEAFGEAGDAIGGMLTSVTSLNARLAEIAERRDDLERRGMLTSARAGELERDRAAATIGAYGDMLSAARGYFAEGSDGYRALLAIEQVYRAYQLASAIQSMALGGQETAFTLGQNAIRAASHGVVAVARAIASLPFPLNLAAGAATIAALAAIGVKIAGGGGGGGRGVANDNDIGPDHSTNAVRSYSAMDAQARDQATHSLVQAVRVQVEFNDPMFKARVQKEAVGATAPMVAAAAAGTKRDVFQTLNDRQVGNRKVSV
ncbi:phage tail length tape measure family protein [Brevundimonas diminuta]